VTVLKDVRHLRRHPPRGAWGHVHDLALAQDRLAAVLALVGAASLFAYAVVQTFQPEDRYGRLFAAYAGVFLIGALLWGWGVDGRQPDRFDWLGAAIVLTGVVIVLWGRGLRVGARALCSSAPRPAP
jgi:small multidrug resistance family-3 protein